MNFVYLGRDKLHTHATYKSVCSYTLPFFHSVSYILRYLLLTFEMDYAR